jgi:asparagine synthase (glutamine-hydrolysing)
MSDADAAALFGGRDGRERAGLARESFAAEATRTAHYPPPYRADYFYIQQRVRRSTQCMIVFQRSAFEVRCPYFDYAFIDFLYGLPEALRASPALHHGVLTRRMPALARVPNEKDDRLPHTNPIVGASHAALQKAKRGVNKVVGPVFPRRPRLYADYENYLRTDLRQWAESILFDARTIERGLFDPEIVRQLWERHLQGDRVWTLGSVAPLITIEMSIRHLIDPGSPPAPTLSAAAGLPDPVLPGGP